jgi:hypothetical protein
MRLRMLVLVLVIMCLLGTFALLAGSGSAAGPKGKCGHGEHMSTQTGGVCVPNGP